MSANITTNVSPKKAFAFNAIPKNSSVKSAKAPKFSKSIHNTDARNKTKTDTTELISNHAPGGSRYIAGRWVTPGYLPPLRNHFHTPSIGPLFGEHEFVK